MRFQTIAWKKDHLELIDQTELPEKTTYVRCWNLEDVWSAIRNMKVRGAPAIGVTAAFGIYLGMKNSKAVQMDDFVCEFKRVTREMAQARPTARNLFDTIERMEQVVRANLNKAPSELKRFLLDKALEIQSEDIQLCRAIGKFGQKLIRTQDSILTHCNAGALATAGMGTALAVVYTAHSRGKKIRVFATETRPFLQGARLTAWELSKNRIPVSLVCDNMVGYLMREKKIDKVIVGADRIARNGDTANKIGTYTIAELARANRIPFYVAAPSTTFDFSLKSGKEIPIEMRNGNEVINAFRRKVVPHGVPILNPAFDVTPNELISGIITEQGVFYPPYQRTLSKLKRSHSS